MSNKSVKFIHRILLAAMFAGTTVVSTGGAESPQGQEQIAAPAAKPVVASASVTSTPYRNQPPKISNREAAILEAMWGIEGPSVKAVESGVIIRFSYRVLDPEKAKPLNDKQLSPVLESPEKGLQLVIPTMEKVGQLRQAPEKIEAGKSYWMAFSNPGRQIKPGDHVDVVIGNLHVRGLQVQ
jgi:hypothetical protein